MKKLKKIIKEFFHCNISMFVLIAVFGLNILYLYSSTEMTIYQINKFENRLKTVEQRVNDVYDIIGDDAAFQEDVYQNFLFLNKKIDQIKVSETKSHLSKKK